MQPENLNLDTPRLLASDRGLLERWIFFTTLLALFTLGSWGCLLTAFHVNASPVPVIGGGLAFCAYQTWRRLDTRKRWWSVSLAGWLLWVLMLVFLFDSLLHGSVNVINSVLNGYSHKLNYDLGLISLPYSAGTSRPTPSTETARALLLVLFPFVNWMSHLLVKSRMFGFAAGLGGVMLVIPMAFSILPDMWAFSALLLSWGVMLLTRPMLGGKDEPPGGWSLLKRRYTVSSYASARPAALMVLPVLALVMLGIYKFVPPEDYKRPILADELRAVIQDGVGATAYMRGGQSNSNRNVQLDALGDRSYTGEIMLRTRFDWNGIPPSQEYLAYKEYLKCFVGAEYTGSSWERLPDEARAQLEALELSFAPQRLTVGYKETLPVPWDSRHNYLLTVENVGANPRCVYIPASISSSDRLMEEFGMEFVDDGFAKSSNFLSGSRNYKLQGLREEGQLSYYGRLYCFLTGDMYPLDDGFIYGPNGGVIEEDEQLDDPDFLLGLSLPYKLWASHKLQREQRKLGNTQDQDLWRLDEFTINEAMDRELLTQEQLDFIRDVEDYHQFVYDNYTQVPDELRETLWQFIDTYGLDPFGTGYYSTPESFAYQISEAFRRYFTYSLSPRTAPEGEDFVEFFLRDSREGYCVHFASAAVLLLRAAGYPARYAEGYVVPAAPGIWTDVPDYNAHAWAEVYYSGVGWVPIEVTPPSIDNPAVYYDATMPEDPEEYIATPVPAEEIPTLPPRRLTDEEIQQRVHLSMSPRPTSQPGGSSSGGKRGEESSPVWPVIFIVLGGLGAISGAVWFQRYLRIRSRERRLQGEDRNLAALSAYRWLLELREWELMCGERTEEPPRWKELAEKARFGRGQVNPEEVAELTDAAHELSHKLRKELGWPDRVRCMIKGVI